MSVPVDNFPLSFFSLDSDLSFPFDFVFTCTPCVCSLWFHSLDLAFVLYSYSSPASYFSVLVEYIHLFSVSLEKVDVAKISYTIHYSLRKMKQTRSLSN